MNSTIIPDRYWRIYNSKRFKIFSGIIFIGIILVSLLFKFSYLKIGYDTGLYHLPKIQWLLEYGHVPGLANLDGRLGFYSIYFYLGAVITWIFGSPNAALYLNLFFISLFLVWLTIRIIQTQRVVWLLLYLISLVGLLYYQPLMKSLYQDVGTYILGIIVLLIFLEKADQRKKISSAWILLAVVILSSIKFSMIFSVLLLVFHMHRLPSELFSKENAWITILSAFLFGILIWHNYWITGWLIYPSSFLDVFNPDWKVPEYLVENQQSVTSAFAKSRGSLEHMVEVMKMDLVEWVPLWWAQNQTMQWFYFIVIGTLVATILTIIIRFKSLDYNLLTLASTVVFGAIAWFLTAPYLRFGFVWLNALVLVAIYLLLDRYSTDKYLVWIKLVSIIIVSLLFVKKTSLGSAITEGYPPLKFDLRIEIPDVPLKTLKYKPDTAEVFYTPKREERAYWPGRLPVASRMLTDSLKPFINDVPRYRGKALNKGFYTDSVLSVKKLSPDSLKAYFK